MAGVPLPPGAIRPALQAFLADPKGHEFLSLDGPGGFYVQFALSDDEPSRLRGEAVSNKYLSGDQQLGSDRIDELVALGWTGPTSSNPNFSRTWSLVTEMSDIVAAVDATARVYGVNPGGLTPRFGSDKDPPASPSSPRNWKALMVGLLLYVGYAMVLTYLVFTVADSPNLGALVAPLLFGAVTEYWFYKFLFGEDPTGSQQRGLLDRLNPSADNPYRSRAISALISLGFTLALVVRVLGGLD